MKRQIIRGISVAGLIAFAALAVLVYRMDSRKADSYRPASAVALDSDASTYGYPYTYRVGDRLCHGVAETAVDPGAALNVYYDPKDICISVTTDPAATRLGDQAMLLLGGAYLAFSTWAVLESFRQEREMKWQQS